MKHYHCYHDSNICHYCQRRIILTKRGFFFRHMSAPGVVCEGTHKAPLPKWPPTVRWIMDQIESEASL